MPDLELVTSETPPWAPPADVPAEPPAEVPETPDAPPAPEQPEGSGEPGPLCAVTLVRRLDGATQYQIVPLEMGVDHLATALEIESMAHAVLADLAIQKQATATVQLFLRVQKQMQDAAVSQRIAAATNGGRGAQRQTPASVARGLVKRFTG